MAGRFYVEIRDAQNALHKLESGYATREQAETIAARRRETIASKGWNMYVHVGEKHQIVT